jgi:hypothetical protein
VDGRRQIPTWWEISLRGWEKVFRHIGHLVCHIHRIGGNFPSPFLSVYSAMIIVCERSHQGSFSQLSMKCIFFCFSLELTVESHKTFTNCKLV